MLSTVRRKSVALLAFLIAEDRTLTRDHLADLFWPDLPLNKAKRNLSWCLSNLAAHLPDCLHTTPQTVRYAPHAAFTVDSVEAGSRLNHPDVRVQQQALDLMQGPFMDGFAFVDLPELEAWHLTQQEIWRQRQQRLFGQVIDGLCAAHELDAAAVYARRWAQTFPWDEAAHRALMSCLAASGRPDLALDHYAVCRRRLREEVDLDPAPETEALYHKIQAQQATAAAAQRSAVHLPHFLTPLIGRENEQKRLTDLLMTPNYRLVSLVGAGGSGKTRLAVATAESLHSAFGDGVVFVSFAETPAHPAVEEDDEPLYAVLAGGLGLPIESGKCAAQVARYLAPRHLLLVLDNFEHLTAHTGFVLGLLKTAPRLTLLVTSRQPLGVTAEFVLPLSGLGVPQSDNWHEAMRSESVQLFVERMERTFFGVPDAADVRREIVCLCHFVEGSPLAIEMLAPLVAQEPSAQWTALLRRNFAILETTRSDVPLRQRSLRTVFEQTWDLLPAAEQRLLAACAVFKAPFPVDAVVALSAEDAHRATEKTVQQRAVRNRLMSLVQRSLLTTDGSRFSMHPLLQQFAAEKLAADPSWQATVQRTHAHFFMEQLTQAHDKIYTVAEAETIRGLAGVREDVFSAWLWFVEQAEIELLTSNAHTLSVLCDLRGWWREGESLLAAAAEAAAQKTAAQKTAAQKTATAFARARFQVRQAVMLFRQSRYAEAEALASDVLARLTTLNAVDPTGADDVSGAAADVLAEIAFAEKTLGNVNYLSGEIHKAVPFYRRSLAHARRLKRPIETAQALSNLGMTLRVLDGGAEPSEAERLLKESLELRRDAGDLTGAAITLANLGGLAAQRQDWSGAQQYHFDALAIRRALDDRGGIMRTLDSLANCAYNLGDYAASYAWAEEGEALSRQLHDLETLSRHLILKGRALCALGRYAAAQPELRETLAITGRLGVKMHILFSLYALVQGILDGPSPRPAPDAMLWPKLVQLAAHVAENPSTLPSTARRAHTVLARLLAAAPQSDIQVDPGNRCSLGEAIQLGYQVVELLAVGE